MNTYTANDLHEILLSKLCVPSARYVMPAGIIELWKLPQGQLFATLNGRPLKPGVTYTRQQVEYATGERLGAAKTAWFERAWAALADTLMVAVGEVRHGN